MSEKLKKLRDASVEKLGYSKNSSGYDLLISMTDALYIDGHAKGVKDILEIFRKSYPKDSPTGKVLEALIASFDELDRETNEIVDNTLGELEDKKKKLN